MTVPYAASLSRHPVPAVAAGEVIGEVLERIGPEPDLAVLFATAPLTGAVEDVAATVRSVLSPRTLLGATAASVLGGAQEIEEETGLALWAGRFGAVTPVRLEAEPHDGGFAIRGLPPATATDGEQSTLLLLADPFSFPAEGFLAQLAGERPGLGVVGGLASAARGPGGNRLVLDNGLHHDGAVGALVTTDRLVGTVVSQGCRPVGEAMIVTRADGNVIFELAGRPALDRLTTMAEQATEADRDRLRRGLHLGVVTDETKATFNRGDFLVRNVLGADRRVGAIAVGDVVEVGSTVQFQVRDAEAADDDLRNLLADAGEHDGALVFTCNGRGTHLFGRPHHDADLVAGVTGGNCAGMFCAGEVGPVGGRNHLHGFTASVALFRD